MNDKYAIQLDGLRFYAVLMIMVAHWLQWQWANKVVANIPFVHGVILFFVLSGFLITRILFTNKEKYKEAKQSYSTLFKNFYIRRFLRIFPIYYVTIIFLFIINFENVREIFIWLITYTSNIYQSIHNKDLGSFNHFWSLAVEEQFYLFWPLIILFTNGKKSFFAIIFIILISLVTKSYIYIYYDNWRATTYFTLSCMNALGIGSLLAYFVCYNQRVISQLSKPIWLYVGVFLYLLLLVFQIKYKVIWYKEIFNEFIFAIVSAFFILKASNNGFKGFSKFILENNFVNFSGKISYGLYVFHLFIPSFIFWLFPEVVEYNHDFTYSKYILFVVYYFVTFGIAYTSYRFLELPINNLKRKFPYFTEKSF